MHVRRTCSVEFVRAVSQKINQRVDRGGARVIFVNGGKKGAKLNEGVEAKAKEQKNGGDAMG